MKSSILKIITASVVLFFGCQTSRMAEDNATSQKADEQSAAEQSWTYMDAPQMSANSPPHCA